MNETAKVVTIAFAGALAPASASWFVDTGEPIAKFLLICAQIAVALITALFVFSKWRKNSKKDS